LFFIIALTIPKGDLAMKTTWKRQYAALLLLFCLILNGAILTFGVLRYDRAYAERKDELRAFGEEIASLGDANNARIYLQIFAMGNDDVIYAHGETWYDLSLKDTRSDTWEPPVDTLSQSEKRDVILKATREGKEYLCYAMYSLESSDGVHYILYDLTSLKEEQTYLTLVACGVGLVFSVVFALVLANTLKKVATSASAEEVAESEQETVAKPLADAPEQDVGAHCRALVARLEETAEESGVALAGSAAPHCTVHCEPEKLTALTESLLTYAIAVAPRGGRVSLLITRREGVVSLRVDGAASWEDKVVMRLSHMASETGATLLSTDNTVTVRWEEGVS
jgi:Na+-transporting methylmalonyl-CoA/oxaloacetate decarboxylase gamma subunit